LSEEELNEKIRYLKGRIRNTTESWKKRYRVELAALEKQLAIKTDTSKPAAATDKPVASKPTDAKSTSPDTWRDAVGAGKLKDEHRTRATSKAGEVEDNVKGAKAPEAPKPEPRPASITKKANAAAMARKEAARKRRALPNAPRPSETAGVLKTQIKEDNAERSLWNKLANDMKEAARKKKADAAAPRPLASPPKITNEKKSAKSKSSWRRVKDDGGPDDSSQGKRVYDTPFGRITVDSTDEGMFPDEYGGDPKDPFYEDRSNLRKGGTTKKKASSKKKAAPVQKYGFRQGSFTARGGMYKVKG
jgi:hypothetical protein